MPQPVDFQTEIAKTTAAERIQELTSRLSLAAQQRQALLEQEDGVKLETQVQESHESENPNINADGRGANPQDQKQRREKKKEPDFNVNEQSRVSNRDGEVHRLDVTI